MGDTSTTATVTLHDGENLIRVSANSYPGDVGTYVIRLARQPSAVDTTRPGVTLVSPGSAGPWPQLSLRVDATVDGGLRRIVGNLYRDATLIKSTQSAADGAKSASHTATMSLPDGNYTLRYNAQDLTGNISQTGSFAFTIDTTAPTVTVKTGLDERVGADGTYSLVSFKIFDAGKVDKVTINGRREGAHEQHLVRR